MEAKELMIGDWVRLTKNFYTNEMNLDEKLEVSLSDYESISNGLYIVEPIPITEDFLKANFKKKTLYGIYDDYFDLSIREFNDGMYIVNYHVCEMPMPDTQVVGVCFIHELQHVLTLCGIEKELKV